MEVETRLDFASGLLTIPSGDLSSKLAWVQRSSCLHVQAIAQGRELPLSRLPSPNS
jgi:hypothetical protein